MVQYARHWGTTSLLRQVPQDYWKLSVPAESTKTKNLHVMLEAQGIGYPKSANKTRLLELLGRKKRGLLCYRSMIPEELQLFCIQRGLLPRSSRQRKASWLALRLERADESQTFPQFSELPRELRDMVYDFYFMSFNFENGALAAPFLPPITFVSSQLREETLSRFYETMVFSINVDAGAWCHLFNATTDNRLCTWPSARGPAQNFFERASTLQIASIRRLRVTTMATSPENGLYFDDVSWLIDLGGKKNNSSFHLLTEAISDQGKTYLTPHEDSIRNLLDDMSQRMEGKGLQQKDIKRLLLEMQSCNRR